MNARRIYEKLKSGCGCSVCGIGVCLTGCAAGAKTDKAVPQQGETVGGQKRMKIWFDTGGAPGESYGTVLQNGAAAAAKELEP